MGFWKSLKFWDTQAVIESTIETTQILFREAKARYPDRDCHAWLAYAFGARAGYDKVVPLGTFTRTTLFSVLEDDAPIALAYFLLSQEMPKASARFEERFGNVLRPALELVRQGKFLERWEQANPWTVGNIPAMREVVAESFEALAQEIASGRLNNH